MASRLKRRIPVIVSTRGTAAGVGATSWVGSTVPVGPEWLIPVATYDLGTFAPGASIPLTGLYTANGGTPYFTYVSGQTITGTQVTMAVDPVDGDITAPTTETTYTAVIDLDDDPFEADWVSRSTGAGVVWAHDFRYEQEVKQFRVSDNVQPFATSRVGNDPEGVGYHTIFWDSSDGIGESKCVRTTAPNGIAGMPSSTWWENLDSARSRAHFPAGTTYTAATSTTGTFTFPGGSTLAYSSAGGLGGYEGPTNTTAVFNGEFLKYQGRVSAGGWTRPFSALVAGTTGNGLPSADRASGGETRRTYDATSTSAFANFRKGYYGHSTYHTAGGGGSTSADWDGTEFYLQFRVKLSTGRHDKRTPPTGANSSNANVTTWLHDGQTYEFLPSGKLVFIQPGPTQLDGYVIIQSGAYQQYAYQTAPFRMYSLRGTVFLQDPQVSTGSEKFQNVAPYATTCVAGLNTWSAANSCWEWPENEWVTVLYYMKPGRSNDGQGSNQSTWTFRDTHVRVWVAREGATSYTEIFNKSDLAFAWGTDPTTPTGSINNVDFSCYMNNLPGWKGWEQKYTQVIFSKQMIPCPQA
jgi:hypothetical protein